MKNIICLFFGLLIVTYSNAQSPKTSTMRGIIVDDADNSPLIAALIVVDSTKHTTTNVKGEFSIDLPIKDSKVTISYLGYKTVTQNVRVTGSVVNLGIIKMVSEDKYIEKVVVEGTTIISIQKGDTTQFNAAAYKTNPDAYAGDLINKMPGMVVEDDGIKSQGETVKRVYVDGKLMFGDDAKAVMTAVNNLPADAIESIQMFDELSDDAKFSGYDDGKVSRSLNIVTKYKIKTAATGRVEAGYGQDLEKNAYNKYQDRYTVNTQANIFSAKRTVMIGATANNTNSTTGRGGYNRGGGAGDGLNNVKNANFSYNQEWENLLKFNAMYSYSKVDSDIDRLQIQNYFPTSQFSERIYSDTTHTNSVTNRHIGGMRIEYTPNRKNRFFFMPNFSYNDANSDAIKHLSNSTTYPDDPLNPIDTFTKTTNKSDSKNYNTGSRFIWLRNLGKPGRTVSLMLNGTYSNNDSYLTREDISITTPLNLETFSNGWSKNFSGRITYNEPLSLSSKVSANYGLKYENSRSNKRTYDLYTNQLDSVLSNVFTRNYTMNSAGLGYSYSKGNYRLNFGTDYQYAKLNKSQELPLLPIPYKSFAFDNFLPYLSFRYSVNKTKNFNVNYSTNVDLPSVEQLQNVVNNSNPLQLSAGNPSLAESYSNSIQLRYNTSNLEKASNMGFEVRASSTSNYIAYMTRYFSQNTVLSDYNGFVAQKGSQLRTPLNLNGYYTISTQANYAFPVKKLKSKMDLTLGYTFQHLPSTYRVDTVDYTISNVPNLRIQFESNIKNVDFSIISQTKYSLASNSSSEIRDKGFFNQSLRGSLNVIFLKGFVITSDITYNYNKDISSTGFVQKFTVWNAGFGHKVFKKSQGEFKITMYDILKQNQSLKQNINDRFISNTWTNIMGRYVMATFSYRFNSLSNLQPKAGHGFDEHRSEDYRSRIQSGESGDRGGMPGRF